MEQETKQERLVTADMTVADIVDRYPEATQVMLDFGLHCFGCGGASVETLEEGSIGHGMPQDVFEKMLDEINCTIQHAKTKPAKPAVFAITQKAADKVKAMAKAEGKDSACLRVLVISGGCAGFRYDFDFVDAPQDGDHIIESFGLKTAIEKSSMDFLSGSTLDYVETLNGSGFKIENPNVKHSCGCGNSVG